MKVAAHPILVAVALGFLAPSALEEAFEDTREPAAELRRASEVTTPDAAEQARAERLWREASESFRTDEA